MDFKHVGFNAEPELYEALDRYARIMETTISGATRMLLSTALSKINWPEEGNDESEIRFVKRYWALRREHHQDRGRPRTPGQNLHDPTPADPGLPIVRGANWSATRRDNQ